MLARTILGATSTASRLTVGRNNGYAAIAVVSRCLPTSLVGLAQQGNQRRSYHPKVIDHYENPRNVGSLSRTNVNVGTGLVGAPACGDVMKLQILVDENTGEIRDVKFKTFGCGSAIASSSYATERIKGLKVWEASKITNTEIAKELCLPPVKLHCSMLAEDAIKSAIKDWQSKNETRRAPETESKSTPDAVGKVSAAH